MHTLSPRTSPRRRRSGVALAAPVGTELRYTYEYNETSVRTTPGEHDPDGARGEPDRADDSHREPEGTRPGSGPVEDAEDHEGGTCPEQDVRCPAVPPLAAHDPVAQRGRALARQPPGPAATAGRAIRCGAFHSGRRFGAGASPPPSAENTATIAATSSGVPDRPSGVLAT